MERLNSTDLFSEALCISREAMPSFWALTVALALWDTWLWILENLVRVPCPSLNHRGTKPRAGLKRHSWVEVRFLYFFEDPVVERYGLSYISSSPILPVNISMGYKEARGCWHCSVAPLWKKTLLGTAFIEPGIEAMAGAVVAQEAGFQVLWDLLWDQKKKKKRLSTVFW